MIDDDDTEQPLTVRGSHDVPEVQGQGHQHDRRDEWPPVQRKRWRRIDNHVNRFRTSSSAGPDKWFFPASVRLNFSHGHPLFMWSDVFRRLAADLDTGTIVADERFSGNKRSRELHRPLPRHTNTIETVLYYKVTPILEYLMPRTLRTRQAWTWIKETSDCLSEGSRADTMVLDKKQRNQSLASVEFGRLMLSLPGVTNGIPRSLHMPVTCSCLASSTTCTRNLEQGAMDPTWAAGP